MTLTPAQRSIRLGLLALAVIALATGIAGGLARLGVGAPGALANATALHGALMIGGFLGTVIGMERAVALGRAVGYIGPLESGLGALLLLLGEVQLGAWLMVVAAASLVLVSAALVLRQAAASGVMLVAAAAAWLASTLLFALDASPEGAITLGFAFLVFTIAAERLDMARLTRRRPLAGPLLAVAALALLAGAVWTVFDPAFGGALYGAALLATAAWFAIFDIARQTVRTHGLGRYAAVCILGGYAWLGIAGIAWFGTAQYHWPARDLALHALALGFVMSMILGHAPIIAPAVGRVKCAFDGWFYLAPAALHASLLVRFVPGFDASAPRAWGGILNAATLVIFAILMGRAIRRAPRAFPHARAIAAASLGKQHPS